MTAMARPTAEAVPLPVTGAATEPVSWPAVVNMMGAERDDVPVKNIYLCLKTFI